MIRAVIFDMDGVIIDSEPFWEDAEIEVFNNCGVPMTREMCQDMKGRKIDEVVKHWYQIYKWENKSCAQIVDEIIAKMHEFILEKGEAMPGLLDVLEYIKQKDYLIGLASSSKMELIQTVITKLNIEQYFKIVHSAENEPAGKPEPFVYKTTAKKLGVSTKDCIAIEDSFLGLQSALSAGMKTIAIPESSIFDDPKFDIADYKIKKLSEFKLIIN